MRLARMLAWTLGSVYLIAVTTGPVQAHAPSGAIFTTLVDGSEVNFNHFPSKDAVYLDGGPGPGAPQTAAGLDDGTYVFQVTDPSGKMLLSTDPARCRQFAVSEGIIVAVVDTDCEHATGADTDHPPAITVQLFPFDDTPNNGGVYKAWVTPVGDFVAACEGLGVPNGLDVVDCGTGRRGANLHGFIPSHSKTDNFKVREAPPREIDPRFIDSATGALMDGFGIVWTDTLGASNVKWTYFDPSINVNHEAHIEAVEDGTHRITVQDQPGCFVHDIYLITVTARGSTTEYVGHGPQTVSVPIRRSDTGITVHVDAWCESSPDHF